VSEPVMSKPGVGMLSNTQSDLATVVIVIVAVLAAIVLVESRGGPDVETLVVNMLAFTAPTIAAILALMKAAESVAVVKDLHIQINSRMTQLLELTAAAAHAEGVVAGHVPGPAPVAAEVVPAISKEAANGAAAT
jgi:hypothetical protein